MGSAMIELFVEVDGPKLEGFGEEESGGDDVMVVFVKDDMTSIKNDFDGNVAPMMLPAEAEKVASAESEDVTMEEPGGDDDVVLVFVNDEPESVKNDANLTPTMVPPTMVPELEMASAESGDVIMEKERPGLEEVVLVKDETKNINNDANVAPVIVMEVTSTSAASGGVDVIAKKEEQGKNTDSNSVGEARANEAHGHDPSRRTISDYKDLIKDCKVVVERLVLHGDSNKQTSAEVKPTKTKTMAEDMRPCKVIVERLNLDDYRHKSTDVKPVSKPKRNDKKKVKAVGGKRIVTRKNKDNGRWRRPQQQCPTCGKRFGQKSNLITHMLIHQGEKPFRCPVCRWGFRQYNNLKIHMARYHPETPVPLKINNYRKRSYALSPVRVPVPEDPLAKFNCHVGLSRWDVDGENLMNNSLIRQKFDSMANGRQELFLQVKADGKQCKVQMETDLLAHFLQPMSPPPPESSTGVVRVNLSDYDFNKKSTSPTVKMKKKSSVQCPTCLKYFTSSSLVHHMRIHTGERPYECQHCKKRFSRQDHLNIHIKVHTGERLHQCSKCEKKFTQFSNLHRHAKKHHPGEKVVNQYANRPRPTQPRSTSKRESPQRRDKAKRITRKRPKYERRFKCTKCKNTTFTHLSSLALHTTRHHSSVPKKSQVKTQFRENSSIENKGQGKKGAGIFGCTACGRKFKKLDIWKKHMQMHSGDKSNILQQCTICHKSFKKNYMKCHMRTHTGERPYECPVCEKRFQQSSTLNVHMRYAHFGGARYKCQKCKRQFSSTVTLNYHVRKYHSGEKVR